MNKRILSVILTLCMVLTFVPTTVFAAEGITPKTPQKDSGGVYQIGTAEELYGFAQLVNSGNTDQNTKAVLTADITVNKNLLSSLEFDENNNVTNGDNFVSWTPIGNNSNKYTGTFDGQGHTISGLYFNDSSTNYVGLFGCLGSGGEIKNVGVIDSYLCGKDYVGGVCGRSDGTITGCYNAGTVSGTGNDVGGVCGRSAGTITGCYNTGTVSGYERVGGVCGLNYSFTATITGCYNTGRVSGTGNNVGGVCGYNDGKITGCYNAGTVSGYERVGGVCGRNELGTITGCYTNNGGVCGTNKDGTISSDCAEYIETESENKFKDGTVCKLLNTTLINAKSEVRFYQGVKSPELIHAPQLVDGVYQISSAAELFWFAQLVNSGGTDQNTKAVLTADIVVNKDVLKDDGNLADDTSAFTSWTPIGYWNSWTDYVNYSGTFDGQGHTISGLYFNNTSTYYVGLFGCLGSGGEIKNVGVIDSYFTGYLGIGGVCGDYEEGGTITACYNTGTVIGSSCNVGGVCGLNEGGTITGCYNTGAVIGSGGNVGGVCGNNWGTITGCYTNNGGVCGYDVGDVKDCEVKTDADFADGTVCKLLNTALQNANFDVSFCQRIGTDASPLLTYQFEGIDEHTYEVYTFDKNTFKATCLCGKKDTKIMELALTTEKTVVANGEENTLTATLSNYDNETVTYKWYQNDDLIENAASSTYKMPTGLPLGSYTYEVQVTMEGAGTITQSVSVFVDNDPPTGEISVGTKSWTESPDNITFDSFFKDTQTVTITASDNSGKPVKIEYLVSHKELTAEELANEAFTAYSDTFSIDPDNEYIIYARLTDESGNVAYISSNGIVLDSVVPLIFGIENGKTYCEEQTFTVTEDYLESVTVNGTPATLDENNQFTLKPAEGTQEIVVTDKAGNVSAEMIVTVNNGHTDENPKDHKCDICGENVGTHEDIDKDHKCDYGCDEEIGEHKALDGKHTCDYCGEEMTTCEDENPKDHKCDICGENVGTHEDIDKDHKCDYGCAEAIGEHKALDGKHTCDYCGKEMTTCEDENPKDHKCDICGENVGTHEDIDKDHKCDYGCAEAIGEHKALDGKHTCDYCGKEMTTCEDENPKDHKCDICGENVGTHEDIDKDHRCDYGCAEEIGEHKALDGKHTCDYCGEEMTTCEDENPKDHKCDICGENVGTHEDKDNDHKCDYCGEIMSLLLGDVNGDGNVNIKDATEIQKAVAFIVALDDVQQKAADVNGDGNVNVKDATAIQKHIAYIETGYKIGEYILLSQ